MTVWFAKYYDIDSLALLLGDASSAQGTYAVTNTGTGCPTRICRAFHRSRRDPTTDIAGTVGRNRWKYSIATTILTITEMEPGDWQEPPASGLIVGHALKASTSTSKWSVMTDAVVLVWLGASRFSIMRSWDSRVERRKYLSKYNIQRNIIRSPLRFTSLVSSCHILRPDCKRVIFVIKVTDFVSVALQMNAISVWIPLTNSRLGWSTSRDVLSKSAQMSYM